MAMIEELDPIDRRIVGYLQVDGRAAFRSISQHLDLPERTVSRRGQELLASGTIQVTGIIERSALARKEAVVVRIVCAPGTNTIVATALANLPESIFVYLTTGNNECITEICASAKQLNHILLNFIPSIPGVQTITSFGCLRYFRTVAQWNPGILTDSEIEKISLEMVPRPIQEIELNPEDELILETLSKNGRATFDQISRTCGLTEPTARRKTTQLLNSGALSIHAVVDPAVLGFPVECWIWIQCPPKTVEKIAQKIIEDKQVRYLVTTSGAFQILFAIALPSRKSLNSYIQNISTEVDGISHLESYILLEPYKRSGRKVFSIDS